jgi:hypothetical protein
MTGLFPARYFGNIAYFKSLYKTEVIVFEQHEHFYKQQEINRFSILSASGKLDLTVPVSKPFGSKTPICNVLVSNQQDWRKNHLKSLESAYSSSPFYDYYTYDIVRFMEHPASDLLSLNLASIELVCHWLDLAIPYQLSCSHEQKGDFIDYRKDSFTAAKNDPHYKQVFTKQDQFIDHLSILDLIFNEGPMARNWITRGR